MQSISPLFSLSVAALRALNFETNTEYAGLLTGMKNASNNLQQFFVDRGYLDKSGSFSSIKDISLPAFLEKTSLKDAIDLGIINAKEFIDRIGINNWSREKLTGAPNLNILSGPVPPLWSIEKWPSIEATWDAMPNPFWVAPYKIAVPLEKLADCEQEFLKWCDNRGVLLTAKRVDYVIGQTYVQGVGASLPIIGSLGNILCKNALDVGITKEDWVRASLDTVLIVSLVAAPYLLPLGSVGSGIAAFTAQTAVRGAAIGGVHGSLLNGVTTYVNSNDISEAFTAAGKGAVNGAAVGAIGGAATGSVLYRAGASLKGSLYAGAAGGGAMGGTQGAIDGFSETGTISGAVVEAGEGIFKGGFLGGILGVSAHGLGRLTSKIVPIKPDVEGLPPVPDELLVRTARPAAADIKYGDQPTQPGLIRHHVKPLSLGGTDQPSNIAMVPKSAHAASHPSSEILKAPIGTIFYKA